MIRVAPQERVAPLAWRARDMEDRTSWQFQPTMAVLQEIETLEHWAHRVEDPVNGLKRDSVETPGLDALAKAMGREIDQGTGVAWVRGFPTLPQLALRLTYLKIALVLGSTIDTYGRLYEVQDSGASYRDRPIPVSQTRESTGMHTDSSGKSVCPGIVGLACVRQAPEGGCSRLASAAQAHEVLRVRHPQLLERLYHSFVRDVVTPGGNRGLDHVRQNRFPVFSYRGHLSLRYMRYWIEKGHGRIGERLDPLDVEAFDALDAALEDPSHVLAIHLNPGDFLFINNRTTAHDRDAYVDDLAAPRLFLRLWLHR